VSRVNAEYVKLGARRITFVAASGDAGAPGRTNEGCDATIGVVGIFPGSSPYVLSVGGTYVSAAKGTVNLNSVTPPTTLCGNDQLNQYGCANGTGEGITNFGESFLPIPWTAGGGFSFQFVSPSGVPTWQASFVQNYLSQNVKFPKSFVSTGRAYPDVAANSNMCAVFNDDGTLSPEAGTSCATPIVAAILSLVNWDLSMASKPLVGFVNPMLYSLASSDPTAFNRPEPKNNHCTEEMCCPLDGEGRSIGYFSTVNGNFDSVSGLGSPNAMAWRQHLGNYWAKKDAAQ
jgi:tripeptidyl-peptidase-1